MRACERGWRATHDPAFVIETSILTYPHRQPPPLWQTGAVISLGTKRRTKGYVTHALNNAMRYMRYQWVRDAQESGLTWDKAYVRTAEML
jgi:hypothetical protein